MTPEYYLVDNGSFDHFSAEQKIEFKDACSLIRTFAAGNIDEGDLADALDKIVSLASNDKIRMLFGMR